LAQKSDFFEAIVIGSGFGGAVAALRLGQAGIDTLVLERGQRWPISKPNNNLPDFGQNTFATFDKPDGRAAWLSNLTTGLERTLGLPATTIDVEAGVLELIEGTNMEVRAGAGVGGSTLVYNAILLEPRKDLFEKVFPSSGSFLHFFDEMHEIYYPRVRSIIQPATIPPDILATDSYKSTRVNFQQAQNAGFFDKTNLGVPMMNPYSPTIGRFVEYAVDWDVVKQEMAGNARPSAIDGQSWYGLNSGVVDEATGRVRGAKKSVDQNYLYMAEHDTKHVTILPLHVVVDISGPTSEKLYIVSASQIDVRGSIVATHTFTCRYLFLAAGSMGTSAILVKAKHKGTLPGLNQWVGQYWGSNGDIGVVRGGLRDNNPGTGGPAGHFLAEDPNDGPSALVELVTQKNLKSAQLPGTPGGVSVFIGLGLAPPVGYFEYDPDHDSPILQPPPGQGGPSVRGWRPAVLRWPGPADPRLGPFVNGAQSMLKHLDTSNSKPPASATDAGTGHFGNPATTAHPVGGAVLGKVCRGHGQVIGQPGLYVIDAAFIPGGSVGNVNPAFTVGALAERNIEWIIKHDIMGQGDDDQGDDNQQ
jgi:cholesterol oxidase